MKTMNDAPDPSSLFCLLSAGLLTPGEPSCKPEWLAVMRYVRELRARSIHPAEAPLPYDWLDIGPGYCYGPGFGHFDLTHQILDFAVDDPELARRQMLNQVAVQHADGKMPFAYMGENPDRFWLPPGKPLSERLLESGAWPPLWPAGVEACLAVNPDGELLSKAHDALRRQLAWFRTNRKAAAGGYYYGDILERRNYESGIDESIRFSNTSHEPAACVDASSHIYWCLRFAAAWAERLGRDSAPHRGEAEELRAFIQRSLFCEETDWFHDAWSAQPGSPHPMTFEGMWPLVAGAATREQASRALEGVLLSEKHFNTAHPIATVSVADPGFELRMWRGPAWNCMTLWACEGCLRYGRADGAVMLLEKALDDTAAQFARTGTIWEFYHPFAGEPERVARKPGRKQIGPCRDYLGHNSLNAMARVWASLKGTVLSQGG